jgi:hypothetical protein
LFSTDKIYGPVVIRIRAGDMLFLNNLDHDTLLGIFLAESDGGFNIEPEAFGGRYPYQVKVRELGHIQTYNKAKEILHKYDIKRNTPLFGKRLIDFTEEFYATPVIQGILLKENVVDYLSPIQEQIKKLEHDNRIDIEDEIPIIQATTFCDFPKQSYGLTPKGNNKYAGVTPALIIYNMVWSVDRQR